MGALVVEAAGPALGAAGTAVELAQVECPVCAGSGAIDEVECPVCDGHGSVEGGVRTISLHNIRYELSWRGAELWMVHERGEVKVGDVSRGADGRGWVIRTGLVQVIPFESEAEARRALETGVVRLVEEDTELDII